MAVNGQTVAPTALTTCRLNRGRCVGPNPTWNQRTI